MKIEWIIGVMLILSIATSLLTLWNRRRVARKYTVESFATGGYIASTPYRLGEFPSEQTLENAALPDNCRIVMMPEVCKPTTVTIKSYTKADLMAAFEKGRLTERAELVKQLSNTKPGVGS